MKRLALALIALLLAAGFTSDSKLTERQRALHALNRLAFGPRPGDVDKLLQAGVDSWIDQQLRPDVIPDRAVEARLQNFQTLGMSNGEIMESFYKPIVEARRKRKQGQGVDADSAEIRAARQKGREVVEDLVSQRIIRAAESDRQLNEVMFDFWFNHFNVFIGKGQDRFMLTSYERDTIRPHMWGRFEDLLMATAKSPAMLFYLDNARSVAAPENRRPFVQRMLVQRRPDVARKGGLNENYAREIMELHTLGVDGGYTQKDVTELARVFTGWTIDQRTGRFIFRPAMHDIGAKSVLGVRFPAGGGIEEGERMIHILAHQPATAHHIALQLCQRLVSDDPPKALVDRVTKKFLTSGGDLRQTVKAIIDSPEFWDPKDYRAKVKTPFEYVISAVRAVNATINNPLPIARALQQIGEPLYGAQPPTGYSDKADVWINTGALMNRLNFALALAADKLPGVQVDQQQLGAIDAGAELSEETRATIKERGTDPAVTAGLILGSPEFQRQ
jgi:uncharacterized protein (DUF1800 family)